MPYPTPPDAREPQDFDIVRGMLTTLMRHDHLISDINAGVETPPASTSIGEPLRFLGGPAALATQPIETVFVINDGAAGPGFTYVGDDAARSEKFAGVCWTHYSDTIEGGGFPDAVGNRMVTVLRGRFTARMRISTWFLSTATTPAAPVDVQVGRDVVAVDVELASGEKYGRYMCLEDGTAKFVGAAPTSAEIIRKVANIVGTITRVDGDFADVDFDC